MASDPAARLRALPGFKDVRAVRSCCYTKDRAGGPAEVAERCEVCHAEVWYNVGNRSDPDGERIYCKFCTAIWLTLAELAGLPVDYIPAVPL